MEDFKEKTSFWLRFGHVHLAYAVQLVEFSGEARFQIFTQKWLLGNTKYLVSFKLKSLKLNGLRQNVSLD